MMTLVIPLSFGPLAVHATWLVLLVSVAYLAFFLGRVKTDREWQAGVTRRAGQLLDSPWYYGGEPIAINRIDAEVSIFKRRMYREDGFDLREAA
jgi:hypothetical protein